MHQICIWSLRLSERRENYAVPKKSFGSLIQRNEIRSNDHNNYQIDSAYSMFLISLNIAMDIIASKCTNITIFSLKLKCRYMDLIQNSSKMADI